MSDPADKVDPLKDYEVALGAYAGQVSQGAEAMAPEVASLSPADRTRLLGLVEGSLEQLGATVEREQLGYAARRVALAGAIDQTGETAKRFLGEYSHFKGAEQIAPDSRDLYRLLGQQTPERRRELKVAFRDPLPSQQLLNRTIGEWGQGKTPLASLELALRRADSGTEAAVAPGGRDERDRSSTEDGPDPRSLDAKMRRLLGPEFDDVEKISSLLAEDVRRRSAGSVTQARDRLNSLVDPPFLQAVDELLGLEGELEKLPERTKNAAGEEVDLASLKKSEAAAMAAAAGLEVKSKDSQKRVLALIKARRAEIQGQINELRTTWVKENPLASVQLAVDRDTRQRERERATRQPAPQKEDPGQRPTRNPAPEKPVASFSVEASFEQAHELLGEDRVGAIEAATESVREEVRAWVGRSEEVSKSDPEEVRARVTATLQRRRAEIGDPFRHFDRAGARNAIPREKERDAITARIEDSERAVDEASKAVLRTEGRDKQRFEDRARVQKKLADGDRERLAAWEAGEEPRRREESHPDYFIANHSKDVATARAIESELRDNGLEIPSPRAESRVAEQTSAERTPERAPDPIEAGIP